MAASIFQQRKKNELPFYLILICCEKEYRFCIISKSLLYGMGNGDKLNVFLRALYLNYLRLIEKDYRTISTNFSIYWQMLNDRIRACISYLLLYV